GPSFGRAVAGAKAADGDQSRAVRRLLKGADAVFEIGQSARLAARHGKQINLRSRLFARYAWRRRLSRRSRRQEREPPAIRTPTRRGRRLWICGKLPRLGLAIGGGHPDPRIFALLRPAY